MFACTNVCSLFLCSLPKGHMPTKHEDNGVLLLLSTSTLKQGERNNQNIFPWLCKSWLPWEILVWGYFREFSRQTQFNNGCRNPHAQKGEEENFSVLSDSETVQEWEKPPMVVKYRVTHNNFTLFSNSQITAPWLGPLQCRFPKHSQTENQEWGYNPYLHTTICGPGRKQSPLSQEPEGFNDVYDTRIPIMYPAFSSHPYLN